MIAVAQACLVSRFFSRSTRCLVGDVVGSLFCTPFTVFEFRDFRFCLLTPLGLEPCRPRNTPAPQSPFLGSAPVWGDRASMSHAMSCPQLPHASARPGYDVERDGSMAAMSGDVGRGLYPPYPDEDSTGIGRARARILAAKAQLERLNHYSPSNMDFGGTTVRQDDVTFVCFNPPMLDQFAPLDV